MSSLLIYRKTLKKGSSKLLKSVLLILFVVTCGFSSFGQSKEELQQRRDELNKQIAYTQKLIADSKKNQESAYNQLLILDRQITFREKLVRNIRFEIEQIGRDIDHKNNEIVQLEKTVDQLKSEYGKMVYQAYKNRNSYDRLMYIFASEDFYQAYRRLKVMQHYADVRKQHADQILNTQADLSSSLETLIALQKEKESLADSKLSEQDELAADKNKRQESLNELKQKEQSLKKQQQAQEAEKQKLNKAIQRIIEEELKAEKAKNNGKFELTPEGKIVNENFEKNKGHLHWPVVRGVITGKFGKHAHPTIPGISVESNGIDITTEKGSKVLAVFEGSVSKIFSVPGAGMNVIIRHGAYATVYAYLKTVTVKIGDTVSAQEQIGTVLENRGQHVTHLEIWKMSSNETKAIDPEAWISRK